MNFLLSLRQFLQNTYQERRREWPYDALATRPVNGKGAKSIPDQRGS